MKKFLFSLLLFLGFSISFGNCDFLISDSVFTYSENLNYQLKLDYGNRYTQYLNDYGIYCNKSTDYSGSLGFYKSDGTLLGWLSPSACVYGGGGEIYIKGSSVTMYLKFIPLTGSVYAGCDVMTSQQCQSNYSLIPISDVDQSYCLGNSLCPELDTGSCEDTGDVQWSALYINDIQHLGKPLINIDIPDYIFWDYSTDEEEFNLYVGSGYDQEYIDNVISINSYRPDSEDFTNVFVGGLTLIMPYIVIVLFIIFVWKLIKRIFK